MNNLKTVEKRFWYLIPRYRLQDLFPINRKKLKQNPIKWIKENRRKLKATLTSALFYLFKSVNIKWIDHNVRGYMKFYEAIKLYKIAKKLSKNSTIVEIGAYLGRSTCFIAESIKNRKINFYSIDTFENHAMPEGLWDTYREYYKNIYRYKKKIKIIKAYSYDAVKDFRRERIDMLWIDADHSYKGCNQDIEDWLPLVNPDGFIIFHDYKIQSPDVKLAVDEKIKEGQIKKIKLIGSLMITKKLAKEINLEEYKKELEDYIERKIAIRQTSYKRLEEIAKHINKQPEKAIEGMIDSIYSHLKEEGAI